MGTKLKPKGKLAAERERTARRYGVTLADRYITPDGKTPELPAATVDYVSPDPIMPLRAARAIGRPTEYRPEHCQTIIDCAERGLTVSAALAVIGISRQACNEWAAKYDSFGDALARARFIRQLHYEQLLEQQAREGGDSSKFQATRFALINVAPDDWRERVEGHVQVNLTLADLITTAIKTIDGEVVEQPRLDKPRE